MLKYKYIFQIKYTEAILSNSTRKLLLFEISRMLIAVFKKLLLFTVIFGTLSFPTAPSLWSLVKDAAKKVIFLDWSQCSKFLSAL